MKPFVVRPTLFLKGKITLPGDKSIAHRAIIISALAKGKTKIRNFPLNKDCIESLNAFKKLGVAIEKRPNPAKKKYASEVTVNGRFPSGLKKPKGPILTGDSGTTLRLILGVLSGERFKSRLIAGRSLSLRPMLRVTGPLRMMGARITAKRKTPACSKARQNAKIEEYPPITVNGTNLKGITYSMPVASAQVKSAILLAALYAKGKTKVIEPIPTRDHTERMLKLFKADIKVNQNTIVMTSRGRLISPGILNLPADISSAAFFMVAAAIIPGSRIFLEGVGLNPSRMGAVNVLKRMGADISIRYKVLAIRPFEPMGDIVVKGSELKSTVIKKKEVPSLVDELPVLMVAACFAKGRTIFEGIGELRVKETDRIRSMSQNLKKMGADIRLVKVFGSEGILIQGPRQLKGARVKSFGDHRTAMSMVVAGLAACGASRIDDTSCIGKSFPGFITLINKLTRG